MNTIPALRACWCSALVALVEWSASAATYAFDRSDGVVVQCEVERRGETRAVKEVWLGSGAAGDRHPELGGAAAVVRIDAAGWPVMYFDSIVFGEKIKNEPHMADFIFYHECGHAREGDLDEIEANCYALITLQQLGMIDADRFSALTLSHQSMRRLPSRYGGNGTIFWARTLACVKQKTGWEPL